MYVLVKLPTIDFIVSRCILEPRDQVVSAPSSAAARAHDGHGHGDLLTGLGAASELFYL